MRVGRVSQVLRALIKLFEICEVSDASADCARILARARVRIADVRLCAETTRWKLTGNVSKNQDPRGPMTRAACTVTTDDERKISNPTVQRPHYSERWTKLSASLALPLLFRRTHCLGTNETHDTVYAGESSIHSLQQEHRR